MRQQDQMLLAANHGYAHGFGRGAVWGFIAGVVFATIVDVAYRVVG